MTDPAGLTCQELVELVTNFLEGTMPGADRIRFEQHIAGCEGCATYLDQIRTTIRLSGTLTEDSLRAPARDGLLRAFRDWKQR